ncbi:HAD family hydrolase [Streptomyces goshikiensis]|uniref:HAD family hydrolase n=1 Tax=Streptomyces goshikiensis TaxID=1942 RepID=UPI003650DEBE
MNPQEPPVRVVVVVSGNSAVRAGHFLAAHGLGEYVAGIAARPSGQPHPMKPSPFPLITAAARAHIDVTHCTLIGDSLTDIQAAHAAGMTVISYANKPHKAALFAEAGVDTVTDAMQNIADALAA